GDHRNGTSSLDRPAGRKVQAAGRVPLCRRAADRPDRKGRPQCAARAPLHRRAPPEQSTGRQSSKSSKRVNMRLGHKFHGHRSQGVFLDNDWLADSASWLPTLPYLDTKTFTYCLTDLRGYGRSMDLKGKYDEREAAADTLALADHLGWKKFHLAGFSMTGMVVERLAVDVPERIKCVVAVGPVSAAGIKMTPSERQFFVDVINDDAKCRELADRITGHRLSPQWQEVKLRLARDTRTREAARGYLDMWTLHDFSSECGKGKVPFQVLGC